MGTAIVTVRKGLTDAIAALPVFAGVQVDFAFHAGLHQREKAWTINAQFTQEPASLRQPRTFYNETGTFDLRILVEGVAQDPFTASSRAVDLGHAVEDFVAVHTSWNNAQLGVTLNDLLVNGEGELVEAFNDKGAVAQLTLPIRYRARLT